MDCSCARDISTFLHPMTSSDIMCSSWVFAQK